jgi:hypothetical protein
LISRKPRRAGDDVRHVLRREAELCAHLHGALQLLVEHVVEQPIRPGHHDVAGPHRESPHQRIGDAVALSWNGGSLKEKRCSFRRAGVEAK